MNNNIYNRLKAYPGLELLQKQQVDAVPGGCGLFFRGVTEKTRRYDLLGGIQCLKRYAFRLCRYGDGGDNPVFFLMLAAWIERGAPAEWSVSLENARCVREDQGLSLWEADLLVSCWEER